MAGWAASGEAHWDGCRQSAAAELRRTCLWPEQRGGSRLTHSHRHRECISRGTGCGWGPAGKGTSETELLETGGDPRREEEEEDRELTCSVFHYDTTASSS